MSNLVTDALSEPGHILDSLAPAVLVTDADWRVRYANRALTRALSCQAEELLGKHLLVAAAQFSDKETSGELLRRLAQLALSPPEKTVTQTVPIRIPERKFLRIRVHPYRPGPSAAGYLFLFADATPEGEIDEMKSEFISVASHEMRTPMTSIKGSLELLLGGYTGELSAEASELLGIALTAVDRLVRLINDLLDISKIESGKMELHWERLDLTECVRKSMRSLRSLAEAHKVSILAEPTEKLAPVLADRDRLEQIITNLLSNALKYSPPDSVIRIRAIPVDNAVQVSIIDQGPGIPSDQLERVFERFQQLQGAKKGSGLGLTICRALVEQHHGRIWVEVEPGEGAHFCFELPIAPPD